MGPTRRLNVLEQSQRKAREVRVLDALPKDASELALEKALFGDEDGFLRSLGRESEIQGRDLARIRSYSPADEEENIENVADDDLFFLDAGTADLPDDIVCDLETANKKYEREEREPLWYDSDDERITVSLADNARLRKLRDTEDDDLVDGLEYVRRLRRQYERLHPLPEWVKYARKKRRTSRNQGEDSDSDISIDDVPAGQSLQELLRSAGSLVRQETNEDRSEILRLRPEVIDIQRQKDIASSGPSSIDTMQFHPYYPLLMTAGPSSTINLYHVSPSSQNPHPILTSFHIKGTPITTALFALTSQPQMREPSTSIYISARRRYFHTWSLEKGNLTKISRTTFSPFVNKNSTANITSASGKRKAEIPTCERMLVSPDGRYVAILSNTGSSTGTIHILASETHQPVCQCTINSNNGIADLAFYRDSTGFAAVGKNGEVSEYSIVEQRVTMRWNDEGAVGTTTLALGGELRFSDADRAYGATSLGNDRYVATGSTSGVVNIYDRRHLLDEYNRLHSLNNSTTATNAQITHRPKPIRTVDSLTTPISTLLFSPVVDSSQPTVLLLSSRWKKNALKLVHVPSCTIYKNWPTERTPLGRIASATFSPDARMLAVGNEGGRVRLWRIAD